MLLRSSIPCDRNRRHARTSIIGALALGVCMCLPSPVAAQTLPAPWSATDVGVPSVQGRATFANGEFSISGAGSDVWGTADQFMFVHQRLDGDGVIVARLSSPTPTDAWAKAGIMIRESLDADSKHAFLLTSAGSGRAFHRRRVTGGPSVHTSGGAGTAPVWVMLERRASTIRAFLSAGGARWTLIGTDVIAMSETVYVGLAVTSRNENLATTAALNNVSVTPLQAVAAAAMPSGWTSTDIGLPLIAGSSDYSAGTFTVTGAGADIWGLSDQFHYAYRQVTGDIEIIARVTAVENTHAAAKAGLMIRDALTPNAAHTSLYLTAANGAALHERPLAGGPTLQLASAAASAPYWLRLERRAAVVTAFRSDDGVTWTLVGVATARAAHDSCRPRGDEPQCVGGGYRAIRQRDRAAAIAADEPAAVDLAYIASGQRSLRGRGGDDTAVRRCRRCRWHRQSRRFLCKRHLARLRHDVTVFLHLGRSCRRHLRYDGDCHRRRGCDDDIGTADDRTSSKQAADNVADGAGRRGDFHGASDGDDGGDGERPGRHDRAGRVLPGRNAGRHRHDKPVWRDVEQRAGGHVFADVGGGRQSWQAWDVGAADDHGDGGGEPTADIGADGAGQRRDVHGAGVGDDDRDRQRHRRHDRVGRASTRARR